MKHKQTLLAVLIFLNLLGCFTCDDCERNYIVSEALKEYEKKANESDNLKIFLTRLLISAKYIGEKQRNVSFSIAKAVMSRKRLNYDDKSIEVRKKYNAILENFKGEICPSVREKVNGPDSTKDRKAEFYVKCKKNHGLMDFTGIHIREFTKPDRVRQSGEIGLYCNSEHLLTATEKDANINLNNRLTFLSIHGIKEKEPEQSRRMRFGRTPLHITAKGNKLRINHRKKVAIREPSEDPIRNQKFTFKLGAPNPLFSNPRPELLAKKYDYRIKKGSSSLAPRRNQTGGTKPFNWAGY